MIMKKVPFNNYFQEKSLVSKEYILFNQNKHNWDNFIKQFLKISNVFENQIFYENNIVKEVKKIKKPLTKSDYINNLKKIENILFYANVSFKDINGII